LNAVTGPHSAQALAYIRGDYEKIAGILSDSVKEKPADVEALRQLAAFLLYKKREVDRAKELFRQALAMAPDSVQAASDYAHVLTHTGHPPQEGEELLRQLVAKWSDDPAAAITLASFLIKWKGDYHEGLRILRELADRHPKDYPLLDAYATQLRNVEEQRPEAERIYRQILAEAPSLTNTLGNLAQLLFWQGRTDEARTLLDRALANIQGANAESAALVVELWFYQYAHVPEARSKALRTLKYLLLRGASSPEWPLDPDVERAVQSGHPQPNLLRRIADVIVGRVDLQVLRKDPEWGNIDE
jgi:tetratricopeptide (TPR) repeat protein